MTNEQALDRCGLRLGKFELEDCVTGELHTRELPYIEGHEKKMMGLVLIDEEYKSGHKQCIRMLD